MTPLRELAGQRRLPDHQVMDQDTLSWIIANRPVVGAAGLPYEPLLLTPAPAWFLSRRQADSIHGIGHQARVCVLASLLAEEYRLDGDDRAALCVAAAVHDCRRRDDRADPGHGMRAARWLARHADAVTAFFGLPLPVGQVARACVAVRLHDVPPTARTSGDRSAYRLAPMLAELLKAADALDRYRLPALRWWPDPTYLRVSVPHWAHAVAFDLMARSEQARLDGATHHQALTHALQTLTRQ
ncbi:hypothetical protein ACQP1V_42825 (plasmid) [Microtetraspora malaysiensis]|uniref:hypothetical protein n=1 Tax=Microtetraspora malaysiensis TaxID=161358 RepID=UPI003D8E4C64